MNAIKPTAKAKKSRVMVVEDHLVVREGLVALINREPDLEVCGESNTAAGALNIMQTARPDLVLVDLTLKEGNGLDLVKSAKLLFPQMHFLVISMQDEEVYAERCLKAGADGYIMKQVATEEFIDAIRNILEGDVYLSKKMSARLLRQAAHRGEAANDPSDVAVLTDRELQVYQLIGAGMNTRDIAPHLGISPKTVAAHRENIKIKLGLKDGRALLQSAMAWLQKA
jgi:DNA-binding NarL/FixJ family response regulator